MDGLAWKLLAVAIKMYKVAHQLSYYDAYSVCLSVHV